jgi:hypothetical protein
MQEDTDMLALIRRRREETEVAAGKLVVIPHRFCGPPRSGNGGYVAGVLAERVRQPAVVTLRRPPPLGRALRVERRDDGSVHLEDGLAPVAEARPTALVVDVPEPPSPEEVAVAAARFAGFRRHAFPTCFVCGPERERGDGLRIFAGPVAGRPLVAAPWQPDRSLAGLGGFVEPRFLWAALDCPGYFAALGAADRPALLGRIAGQVTGRVRPGERCTITGWAIGHEGRKHTVGTALFDERGALAATARATWIEPR